MGGRALWLLSLTGCTALWRIDHVDPPPVDSAIDSSIDSPADAPMCQVPAFFHPDFTDTSPCHPWAMPFGVTGTDTLMQGGGLLTVNKATGPGSTGCVATSPIGFTNLGAFVEVEPLQVSTASTALMVMVTQDMSGTRWSISISGGFIALNYTGTPEVSVLYDGVTMKYIRLRAVGGDVIADYSADATNWVELGRDSHAPPMAIYVALTAYESVNANDVARFSHLNNCP